MEFRADIYLLAPLTLACGNKTLPVARELSPGFFFTHDSQSFLLEICYPIAIGKEIGKYVAILLDSPPPQNGHIRVIFYDALNDIFLLFRQTYR